MKINIKYRKSIFNSLLLVILSLFNACGSYKITEPSQASIETSSSIIFLSYSIKKNSNGSRNIQFINKITKKGKVKNINSNEPGVSGDLVCVQLDKKLNILQRIIIKDPLTKNIEFINDSGVFQRKQIILDSIKFSIRLQLNPHAKFISISDYSTFENEEKLLIKTQIY